MGPVLVDPMGRQPRGDFKRYPHRFRDSQRLPRLVAVCPLDTLADGTEMSSKRLIQDFLGLFGYQLRRSLDGFAVQKELIHKDDAVIFDVGASTGTVAKTYRQLFPRARIHCFEPFPGSFEILQRNTAGDSLIALHKCAVSDRSGVATLNANAAPATSSLLETDNHASAYWTDESLFVTTERIEVETVTLDAFCEAQKIPLIDILKLDVQGAEIAILTGAERLLSENLISCIFTEITLVPRYRGQAKFHELLALLDRFGYQLFDFYYPARKGNRLLYGDGLFISKRLDQESAKNG
jgi:FkbM family methyltransferase